MKETLRKYWAIALVLAMTTAVCLLFSCRKSGMFIDEIYTYGLSNSSYAPFLSDIKEGDVRGKIFTRQELLDYVAVTDDEGFDFGSVYYNQVNDVHPPLHYWLTNMVSSLFPNSFTKWTGLALNYVFYMLTLVLLYALMRKLGGSELVSAACAVLYGLSLIGLSTMLMIRMYMLLTLLTLWLAYQFACLMEHFSIRRCLLIALNLLAGLMTQYYFVFYAFFLCAAYVVYALIKKDYRALMFFVPCAIVGAMSLVLFFPASIQHLFADKLVSGGSAVENLGKLAQYPARLKTFISFVTHGMKAAIYVAMLPVIVLLFLYERLKGKDLRLSSLVILLPAYPVFLLVAIISPVDEPRYIYNLIPIFALTVGYVLSIFEETVGGSNKAKIGVFVAIAAFAIGEARAAPPDYLYPEYAEYDAVCMEHADEPCVYFADNCIPAITQDLLQLLSFQEFYVCPEEKLETAVDYANGADSFVAYVDISEFWSSGYKPEEIIQGLGEISDYDSAELLYQNGLSAAYLISK